MNPIIQKRYDKAGPRVAAALSRRNMEAFYCPTAIEGVQKVLELIAPEDVVSWGGAMTADEMNLKELLRRRGQPVIDRDTAGLPSLFRRIGSIPKKNRMSRCRGLSCGCTSKNISRCIYILL